ncbi:MAG: ABC transporter ATP-binding protein, partial [Candidatus Bathyarchaeia archaeon]
ALINVDFYVDNKEIVGLIGPNGAGKTTLFNVICGFYRPDSGKIIFEGKDITKLKPYNIFRLGIARTFQIVRPFLRMSVLENVQVGIFYGKRRNVGRAEANREALRWLEFVGLYEKRNVVANQLTHAERRKLELARALASEPKLLLLDEIAAGLNPTELMEMAKKVETIWKDYGVAILWVEHVMKAIMSVCHRIIVLHQGSKIAEGPPSIIARDKNVIEAYLGETYA